MFDRASFSRPNNHGFSVRRPILLPLFVILLCLLIGFVVSTYWLGDSLRTHALHQEIHAVSRQLQHAMSNQALFFKNQMVALSGSDTLRRHFLAGDRAALLQESAPILAALRDNRITHFYFHRKNRVNFLRVHNPGVYDDRIDRDTSVQAEQADAFAFGAEVGRTGALTLRAVLPWKHHDQLIGYLELGKEVEHFVDGLQQSFGLRFYTFMQREYLDSSHWHDASKLFGIVPDWESFSSLVFMGQDQTRYPNYLLKYVAQGLWRADDPILTISQVRDADHLHLFSLPIRDTKSRVACRVVGVFDASHYEESVALQSYYAVTVMAFLALVLGLFINRVLMRVERRVQHTSQDLRLNQEHLARHETMLRNTLEVLGDGVLVIDGDGVVTYTNSHFLHIWSVSEQMALQNDYMTLLSHILDQLLEPESFLAQVKAPGVSRQNNLTLLLCKDGRTLEHYVFPMPHFGDAVGWVWLFRDITKRDALEQREERALQSRIAISALLETGMESISLEAQLNVAIDILLAVPWLLIQHRGSIFLVEEEGKQLILAAQRDLHPVLVDRCAQIPIGYCLCGQAAQSREIIYRPHIDADHDIRFAEMEPHGHYCVPIIFRERLMGVLNLYIADGHSRNSEEEAFLTTISYTLASLIELRVTEQNLLNEREFSASLLATAPALVVVMDPEGLIVLFNRACQQLSGYEEAEVLGKMLLPLLVPAEEQEPLQPIWQQLLDGHAPNQHENHWVAKNGDRFLIAWSNNIIRHGDGSIKNVIATGMDITKRKEAEQMLQHLAGHDVLTGIPNRRLFHENLTNAIACSQRDGHKLAVLYLDLDRFKPINDRFGHAAGDLLLLEVVERLKASIRQSDSLARLGGDEFAIILTNVSVPDVAEHVAEKILAEIGRPFLLYRQECHVGVSVGIALCPEHGEDAETLIKAADQAMYVVKEGGRNHYCLYQSPE